MEKKILRPKEYEGMSIFRPPLCYELVGRSFDFVMDGGDDIALTITGKQELTYTQAGETHTYTCDVLKADDNVYYINFEASDEGHVSRTFVMDLETMLVTTARSWMGWNKKYPRMVDIAFDFGAIRREDGSLNPLRHGYTSDMVGKAINWNYGKFEIVHVYSSERYYRVDFSEKRRARLKAEGREMPPRKEGVPYPIYEDHATYIKIRDGLYLVNLLESRLCLTTGHGNSLLFVMNLKTMHDVGRAYGTSPEWTDENYTVGAFGEFFDSPNQTAPSTYYIR